MKTIEPVSIWDNGTVQQATILNSYAVNVTLNTSANFWYGLFSTNENGFLGTQLAAGNLIMAGEAYADWSQDSYAWDWVAGQLNLTITGDYIPPVPPEPTPEPTPEPIVEEVIVEEPVASEEAIA
jgi:hypothetical protein